MSEEDVETVFLVVAAGRGLRLGGNVPKAFVMVLGRPLLAWTLSSLSESRWVKKIVVAMPEGYEAKSITGYLPSELVRRTVFIQGGATRGESVRAAFAIADPDAELIGIHDAARPMVSADLVDRVVTAAMEHGAATPALPVEDALRWRTVEKGAPDGPDRKSVWRIQTPQVYRAAILREAFSRPAEIADLADESSLVEACGRPVHLVAGDPADFKVTWQEDLMILEALLSFKAPSGEDRPSSPRLRVGIGLDAHRLAAGRPLWLGGVEVPFPLGLSGHSDADVLCHAVADALLGAAGLGDIGCHFPDTEPSNKGLSGTALLRRTASILAGRNHLILSVDSVVICQQPRIEPLRDQMERRMAEALFLPAGSVTVKGKTTEGMGFTGSGEGIAAQAVALVYRGAG